MRTLETDRLRIRAFVHEDGDVYARLSDAALGADTSGSNEKRRVVFEYHVAADPGLALLHQTPYADRAVVKRSSNEIIGSVGYAAKPSDSGYPPAFEKTPHFTNEVG